MTDSPIEKPLLDNEKKEPETRRENFSFGPVLSGLFIVVSITGCAIALHKVAQRNHISNIWGFIFTPLSDKTNARTRGVMWRIIMIYSFFILSGILGILNTFPKIRKALDQKPRFGRFQSNRSLIISTLLVLLNVLWVLCLCLLDLSSTSFKEKTVTYLYKISSYWLNLLWTLALVLCMRNTIWQYIFNAPYSTVITTHKHIGMLTFLVTILHIILAFAKWHASHPAAYWSYLWNKIWNYSPVPISWKKPNFLWATDLLLKTLPCSLLMIVASMPAIRRASWELFFYLHQIVILCLLVLFIYHSSNFVYYAAIPFVLYASDKLLRWVSIYSKRCVVQRIERFDDLLRVEVDVQHRFPCLARSADASDLVGSVVYLRVPRAKWFEYHPMSLAFNEGRRLFFYIKVVGNPRSWTHRLSSLAGQTGLTAYIEGPYTMTRRSRNPANSPAKFAANSAALLKKEYGENVLIVAGGAGFAGVSTHLRDYLALARCVPAGQGVFPRLWVVLVVPHHRHLQCMAKPLLEARRAACARVDLFVTYSGDAERREAASPEANGERCVIEDSNEVNAGSGNGGNGGNGGNSGVDVEGGQTALEFTVGRPDFAAMLKEVPSERLEVFYCGPKTLEAALFKALADRKSPFAFHPEVFDMWSV